MNGSNEGHGQTDVGRFCAMVGALSWCPTTDKYLLLKRASHRDAGGGQWECVTGRLNQGESYSAAVRREVYEELGVEARAEFIIGTTHFYRGEGKAANELVGVFYFCPIENPAAITLSAEHSESRWMRAADAYGLLPDPHWLRGVISRAESMKTLIPAELLAYHRANGFEV